MTVDSKKYPTAHRYLARLPDGLDAHPACQVKGSVLRGVLDSAPGRLDPDALPEELRSLLAAPPLPTTWMSEVQLNVIMLAYQDTVTKERWESWGYERNRALFRTSLYRVLFLVLSPERLFVGLPLRWSAFRKGTEVRVLEHAGRNAKVRIHFPRNLHDETTLGAVTIAFRAAADAAGGKNTSVEITSASDVQATFEVRWE